MRRAISALTLLLVLVMMMSLSYASTTAATTQSLTIDARTPVSRIEYPFWGINYVAFWDEIQGSAASQRAIGNAGVELIRFPGGEPANWLNWSKPDASPYWTTTSTRELGDYASGVGASLLLQTNPTTNQISDTGEQNDPSGATAAGWVRYTREQQISAPYWEIGNEPDLRLTQPMDWQSFQWYIDAFNRQAAAMKAADPGIKVFGPVGTNSYQWWALGSLDMFLEKTGNRQGSGLVDGVSLHYYPAQGCVGWDAVRAVAQDWPANMNQIKSVIAKFDTRQLPVFISETNAAVGGLNCEINQTMASALANADLLGAYRASGVQAVQFFGTVHGGNGWGLLYGTNEVRPAETPTPTYFILPIWTRAGDEVLRVNGASDPATTLSAYASRRADGSIQVVAINKTAAAVPLRLSFDGYSPRGRGVRIYELKPAAGGIWDKDVIYNGVRMPDVTAANLPAPASQAVADDSFSFNVAPYALVLLDFGAPGTSPAPTTTANPTVTPRPSGPKNNRVYTPLVRR